MVSQKSISLSKKGIIYFFSGTGNTYFISKEFAKLFQEKNIFVELKPIEEITSVSSQAEYDFIGIGYPVYAWKPPPFIKTFLEKLPSVQNKPCFVFCTAGSTIGSGIDVSYKILNSKHYDIKGTFCYIMPENLNFLFGLDVESETKQQNKIKYAQEKLKKDFNDLLENKAQIKKPNFLRTTFTSIWNFCAYNFVFNKQKWAIDYTKCNQCGLCEKICPTKNIVLKKQKHEIKFGNNCWFCTRCYNFCPQKAINYKNINKTNKYGRYVYFKKDFDKIKI